MNNFVLFGATVAVVMCIFLTFPSNISASQTDIMGPAGSGQFGNSVTVLPNGNIVVTDPLYDITTPSTVGDVGAVHLYNGETLALISSLTGSTANDQVGNGGIVVLTNGNFVVRSNLWNGNRGAVTFCNSVTGCTGTVSSANSLVGSTANDQVGSGGITALTNGNYVVRSQLWDNPSLLITDVGAVTWGNGTSGTSGVISITNSLIGSTANDQVGGVTALTNGNYVVNSFNWDNPSPLIANVGAVTWGNGATGISGVISSSNSLIGSTANDQVGGVTALSNGNYVVNSFNWDNPSPLIINVGAVTWGNGATGISGVISSSNSLIGSTANDQVGASVTALTNGNYVVSSFNWDNPSPVITNVGAVTWGNGATGTIGIVSSSNSLIGSTANDQVGSAITALTNGNYVVGNPNWDNPSPLIMNVGAVTWGNGTIGTSGVVSNANSLIGSTANDFVGDNGVTALTNGNYVVRSPNWDNPSPLIMDVGAATWGNGTSGTSGVVSSANSLIGSTSNNSVGNNGVIALTNGNYVVCSPLWDNPSPVILNVGAATWGNGTSGTSGVVSITNSLIGARANDQVCGIDVTVQPLTNGNYVVNSPRWDFTPTGTQDVGAATWGNGTTGISGVISEANSLIGTNSQAMVTLNGTTALNNGNYVVTSLLAAEGDIFPSSGGSVTWGNGATGTSGLIFSENSLVALRLNDEIGRQITALSNGNYIANSPVWDKPSPLIIDAGAVTFGGGASGISGFITDGTTGGNSVIGTVTNGVNASAFDPTRNRIVVGRKLSNAISILSFTTTAIADGDLTNPATWSSGVPNDLVTGIIPSGRTVTISSVVNAGQIHVQCGGNLTGGSSSAYIIGSVRRDFCAASGETFIFPLGDANNYSPVTASNTNGTGNLTAAVTDTFMPGLRATTKSLSRYWSLDGSGITTDLTFQYVDADVNGTETDYKAFRRPVNNDALVNQYPLSTVDAANNTFTAYGVQNFSDWSASAQPLVPTAASVSISGRVFGKGNRGLAKAVITLTQANGLTMTTRTSTFGYYHFDGIEVGQFVVVRANLKGYNFAPQIVTVYEDISDLNFIVR